jgi:hypothetical protein
MFQHYVTFEAEYESVLLKHVYIPALLNFVNI